MVSIDFLDRAQAAIAALHAHRTVITSATMSDDDAARLESSFPGDEEIAAGHYNWERQDTAA